MFRKLFRLSSKLSPPENQPAPESPVSHLSWVEAEQNPYRVRILDCRNVTQTMLSTTSNPHIAARFIELRKSTGEQHRSKVPPNALRIECNLRYPHQEDTQDGPLFVAEVMEDKWDIYMFDGYLYFSRSWTGGLVFRTKIEFTSQEAIISSVEANSEVASGDASLAVRQVDFLVKSHLYRREVPHPLPPGFPDDPQQIALYSFSQYGRWASFATYEDTTRPAPHTRMAHIASLRR